MNTIRRLSTHPDLDLVAVAIREAEAVEIAPRFQRLVASDIHEKSPGEVVTAADRACERLLTRQLTGIVDVPVIGEEAASDDPELLDEFDSDMSCWLVDPLDGTSNFAVGSPDYAVMVAFMRAGVTVASWVWIPQTSEMFIAERGAGATCNGQQLMRAPQMAPIGELNAVIKDRFLPDDLRRQIAQRAPQLGTVLPGINCAGLEYPQLIRGETDCILYWRTLPWDHAPGVLLALEAGCAATRLDGSIYEPQSAMSGLLVAPKSSINEVRHHLVEPSP